MKKTEIAKRIVSHASDLGSSANTAKGAHRFIIKNQPRPLTHPAKDRWDRPSKKIYKFRARETRLAHRRATIPLGERSENWLKNLVRGLHPHRKNWAAPVPEISNSKGCSVDVNLGRYSSSCTYTKWSYVPTVGCYGIIKGNLGLEFHWGGEITYLYAPRGYAWDKDNNGIRLVGIKNTNKDYHPDSDDLRDYSKKAMLRKINTLHRRRVETRKAERESAQKEKDFKRFVDTGNFYVSMKDSQRAGNCLAGSKAFAARHNLTGHVKARDLFKISGDPEQRRLKMTIEHAARRHQAEMERGYALIEDHRI